MSFLNLVMTPDFISIISDGQITTDQYITQTHFKKFETSPNGFVVGITGFELITNEIRKKFYYQPKLTFDEAQLFLRDELEKYKYKQATFGQFIQFNAIIAGYPNLLAESGSSSKHESSTLSAPEATTFHIENQSITETHYQNSAVLSLVPDDISFNPNRLIKDNLAKFSSQTFLPHLQNLQRNALYKVADESKTVNRVIFQEAITPTNPIR
ncbi:hypothetical protein [Lactococcus allomyrinae]|uniref:Uncharacterized protein n=1 Tax=Lactococcus allomyrinae TaxID=2419773 RepID=A0A387BHQ0_9LACT|nr:hypothetical protein [Lactococcus allomyrinae]AYG00636.1 hypothetical protein D7I46_05735 [Lactococcus allomyrinae]